MGFLRLGSKKAKRDTTATLSPSFSSPEPLHIKLNKDEPPLLTSPIADNFMSISTENQDQNGTIGKSLYEDIFSELDPSARSKSAAPEEQQIMRESFEASSIAESSSTSKGGVKVQSSAAVPLTPVATITTTISPTKPTQVSKSRPTRRRHFKQHHSSVPDSDASDSDASSSSTDITSDSVGSIKALDHSNKAKITPEILMARMRERHRQECRKSWMPSPTAEQHNKTVAAGSFYRTASPSMPVMYPLNPMMVPLSHESMQQQQHQRVHPSIVRSASTFSGFYHPLDHQPYPLQLRPLNNQGLPMRAIPPMSPPLSPISPVSPPPMTSMPQPPPPLSPIIQDHQPLSLKQPTSSPSKKQQQMKSYNEDDIQNQYFSPKQPIQDASTDEDARTFLVDKDIQTEEDYPKGDKSMTPSNTEETNIDDKMISSSDLQSHQDYVKSDRDSNGGVRQVVPLGETMPVVLVSESETGTKQYYLLLPQQYGETLQQELQQRQQLPQSTCCIADSSSCTKGSSCSHHRHRHHHHRCNHHNNRRSSSPSNHCSQHQHRQHHHCCRRRPTTGSGSSRADSIISSAQRSSV
ncbi:hypothetical protein K492DRAFT_193970 [Lichtheimia hyalospora FSU 10163]|nr:hypothetical protein K492DRAFT_193970 [Lichtheimia hyalospora FSU 10163]